jgi:5'-3' exonuclease
VRASADDGGKVLLAVDGNSLVHRAYHAQAGTGFRSSDGRPMWAVRGLVGQLLAAIERVNPWVVVVGFDDPDVSVRRDRWPHYKATRVDKLDSLVEQLRIAVGMVGELGIPVIVPPGLEADDVLGWAAGFARTHGGRAVLMTSDRDAFALIDETTSVLRIINGGVEASPLLTPERLALMLGIRPEQYRDFAALRGDPSDNLPGVRGIGPKTAARALAALGSATAIFDDIAAGGTVTAAAIGPALVQRLADPAARERWAHNCQVMALCPEIRVDAPRSLGEQFRPLPGAAVRAVFGQLRLPATLPTALRVLCHENTSEPPSPAAWASEKELWQWHGSYRHKFAPLPKKRPAIDQPALF